MHSAVVFRREEAVAVGGYHDEVAEDYDLWSRIAARYRVINLDRTLIAYQMAPTGLHTTARAAMDRRAREISAANIASALADRSEASLAPDIAGLQRAGDRPGGDRLVQAVRGVLVLRDHFAELRSLTPVDSEYVDRYTWHLIAAAAVIEARPRNLVLLIRLVALSRRCTAARVPALRLGALVIAALMVSGSSAAACPRLAGRLLRMSNSTSRWRRTPQPRGRSPFARTLAAGRIRSGRPTIALVIDHAFGGGAEKVVEDLAVSLVGRGHRVLLCHTRTPPEPQEQRALAAAGVELLSLGRTSRWRLDQWWPLVRALRQERVDVLNAHLPGSNKWCAALRALRPGMRFVATEHSLDGAAAYRPVQVGRFVGWACDRFVTVSDPAARWLIETCRLPAVKVEVVRNGSSRLIPPPDDPAVRAIRRELGAEDELIIGTVGMLRSQKRVDVILTAFQRLRREFPHARLVVVGDGPERSTLERQARQIPEGVRFLGHRDDVGTLLTSFDLFVMASVVEGSPLALIEAMRAGLAVVATGVGGVPELAPHRECALLVAPGDAGGLSDAMASLLRDAPLRAALGEAARVRATRDLGWERVVDEWSALFERVVEEHRRGGAGAGR